MHELCSSKSLFALAEKIREYKSALRGVDAKRGAFDCLPATVDNDAFSRTPVRTKIKFTYALPSPNKGISALESNLKKGPCQLWDVKKRNEKTELIFFRGS